jgi:ferredoxin--NADP+ reductase
MVSELNAGVTARSEINHGLLVLQVTPDFELAPFKAGQYTVLGLPGSAPRVPFAEAEPEPAKAEPEALIKRAYSIASSSRQGHFLEFYVALVRSGALTPRLFALQEGDRIWLGSKIVGMFTLDDVAPGHDIIFIATGTGLAPYISMLRSSYRFGAGHKTIVIHGARTSWDLGYRNDLEGLAALWPDFHYLPIIDEIERDPRWPGPVGFVNRHFEDGSVEKALGRPLTPAGVAVFLCGNPLMIAGMESMLTAKGFKVHSRKEPGQIFVEKYWDDKTR